MAVCRGPSRGPGRGGWYRGGGQSSVVRVYQLRVVRGLVTGSGAGVGRVCCLGLVLMRHGLPAVPGMPLLLLVVLVLRLVLLPLPWLLIEACNHALNCSGVLFPRCLLQRECEARHCEMSSGFVVPLETGSTWSASRAFQVPAGAV